MQDKVHLAVFELQSEGFERVAEVFPINNRINGRYSIREDSMDIPCSHNHIMPASDICYRMSYVRDPIRQLLRLMRMEKRPYCELPYAKGE